MPPPSALVILVAVPALASDDGPCLCIDQVTAFAPRGEVYVEVHTECQPEYFAAADPILAYLEVRVSDLPPIGEDVRVYGDDPKGRETFEFRDLELEPDDTIPVRLSRFGEILGIRSVRVP